MLNIEKNTLHSHPSLLSLRMALTAAERESPSRPHRVDANERRAMQLIARMQADHKKVFPFLSVQDIDLRQQLEKAASIDA
jgi:hypothetical protein